MIDKLLILNEILQWLSIVVIGYFLYEISCTLKFILVEMNKFIQGESKFKGQYSKTLEGFLDLVKKSKSNGKH